MLSSKSVKNLRFCERGDSNPHELPHYHLKVARLPFRHFRALASLSCDLKNFSSRGELDAKGSPSYSDSANVALKNFVTKCTGPEAILAMNRSSSSVAHQHDRGAYLPCRGDD